MCTVSVRKLRLIETGEDDQLWSSKIQRQWGQSPITVRISSSGRTVATLTPQRLLPKSSSVTWEDTAISIDITPEFSNELLVLEVLSLASVPNQVLGVATFHLQAFMDSNQPNQQLTIHVMPSKVITDVTIHSVMDLSVSRTLPLADTAEETDKAEQKSPKRGSSNNSSSYLEFSTKDLFFPLYLLEENTAVVSNVVTVSSLKEVVVLKLMCSDGEALKCFPVGGVTVQPNHRAYFSVTFNPKILKGTTGAGSKTLSVEVVATLPNLERLPTTKLQVHLAPPNAKELFSPFHYWVNGNCVSNRAIDPRDVGFIRSVLPIYLMQLEDEPIIVTDRDTGEQTLISSTGATSAVPVCDLGRQGSNSPRGGGSLHQPATAGGGRTVSPRLRGNVDLQSQKSIATLTLGRISGFPRPKPTDAGKFYYIVVEPKESCWISQSGQSAQVALDGGGDLSFGHNASLILKKTPGKCGYQVANLKLLEVYEDGETAVIGYSTLCLPSIKAASTLSSVGLPFALTETYSRYDDLENCGLAMIGASLKITPER